jgi:hypothetical protein
MQVEIDLHNWKHEDVEGKFINWVLLQYNMGNFPIRVITGNSEKMKNIVKEECLKYDFNVEPSWDGNTGVVTIIE